MDILFTVSNTVKLFLFYHTVNSISTVSPVVNNKGKKNDLLFTGMLLNVNSVKVTVVHFMDRK